MITLGLASLPLGIYRSVTTSLITVVVLTLATTTTVLSLKTVAYTVTGKCLFSLFIWHLTLCFNRTLIPSCSPFLVSNIDTVLYLRDLTASVYYKDQTKRSFFIFWLSHLPFPQIQPWYKQYWTFGTLLWSLCIKIEPKGLSLFSRVASVVHYYLLTNYGVNWRWVNLTYLLHEELLIWR